jgi:hypothetical protein
MTVTFTADSASEPTVQGSTTSISFRSRRSHGFNITKAAHRDSHITHSRAMCKLTPPRVPRRGTCPLGLSNLSLTFSRSESVDRCSLRAVRFLYLMLVIALQPGACTSSIWAKYQEDSGILMRLISQIMFCHPRSFLLLAARKLSLGYSMEPANARRSTGGATATAPVNGFDNNDLSVYFTQKASIASRTATRAIPVATQSAATSAAPSSSSSVKITGAAIAGIAVGGGLFLSTLILGACFLIRHKRSKQMPPPLIIPNTTPEFSHIPFSPKSQYSHAGMFKPVSHYQLPAEPEPVELYGSNYIQKGESEEVGLGFSKPHPPPPHHGSPGSTYSESGTYLSRSNTMIGSPTTPVYHNLGSSPPMPPPNHF